MGVEVMGLVKGLKAVEGVDGKWLAAFFADGLRMGLGSLDDDDEVISISAVSNGRLPLAILSNRDGLSLLGAEVPCPAVLSGFLAQVFRFQPLIKLMEHDFG